MSRDFIKFLATGGFAAFVNALSRFLLTPYLGYNLSIVVAYFFGMTTAWILARCFVFEATQSRFNEYMKFFVVNIFALLQVWGISLLLNDLIFPYLSFTYYPETCAHLVGVIFPVFTSYFGHKYYTFNKKEVTSAF